MQKAIFLLITISFLFCCIIFFEFLKENKVIAKVDNVVIKEKDLYLRKKVYERCYKDIKKDDREVLAELIRDALEEAVLKSKYNLEVSKLILKEKAKWVDKNTRDPKTLKCIKSIYWINKGAYLRNVIKPTLINPKLHQMFSQDTLIHKQERDKILAMMQKVKNNPSALPILEGYSTFQTKEEKRLKISGYEMPLANDPFIEKVLKKMNIGEIWPNIVEDDYSYKIVRLLKKENGNFTWDGIVIPKRRFDDWFKDYATKNIKIKIYDEKMEKKFLEKYPNLWWRNLFID